MANFVLQYQQDLQKKVETRIDGGQVFSTDNNSVQVAVEVLDGGQAATLTGNVVGFAIRANNTTVALTGTRSGNICGALLPEACFAYAGPLIVSLRLVSGTTKTTLLRAVYQVELTSSGTQVDPGSVIPDISNLLAQIEAMEEATAAAEAAASKSVRYDTTQSLTTAQKTRARANIDAAAVADVEAAAAGVAALETVIENADLISTSWADICSITPGATYTTNVSVGETVSTTTSESANFGCQMVSVQAGEKYKVLGTGGVNPQLWAFTDTSYKLISKKGSAGYDEIVLTAPANGYLFVNFQTAQGAEYGLWKSVTSYTIPRMQDDITSLDGRVGAVETRAANTVKYTAQTLSDTYKAQARTNIGAAATADLTTLRNDFENSGIMDSSWVDICTITAGSGDYWTNKEIGETIDLEADFHESSNFGYQIVPVTTGDKFKVSGTGGNNPLLWAFTDSSYKLLSKAPAATGAQTAEITAAANGYLFVNAQTAQQAAYSLEQWQTVYALQEIEAHMDAIDGALYQTADKNLIGEFVFYRRYITSGGVGSTVDMTGGYSNQYGSVVDTCKRGDKYIITGQGGNDPRLWCFVDSSNKIKSVANMSVTATNLEITAPDDGKLIYQVSLSYPYAITKEDVTELETDVKFAEEDVTLFPFTGFDMFRTIAGLGDSYTEGDLVRSGGEWTTINGISYLGSIARRNGVTANNYGSGGSTTKTYLDRQAFANCLAASPSDLYMICFGINDASGSMTVGTVSDIHDADYTQNPDTFCGNYGRIMAQLMAHAPDAKYILIMPWPTGSDYSAYNAAVAAIAAHYGVPCINPSNDPFFTSYFWQAYKSSGHPVAMTYAGMGRAVERLFNRCVQANPTYFKYALIG